MMTKEQKKEIVQNINKLKYQLRKTDYQAIKYAEGEISESEFSSIRIQRREWRIQINLLQAELKN